MKSTFTFQATCNKDVGCSIVEFPTNFVVVDVETTGLDVILNDMIELSAVRYLNGKKTTFSQLIHLDYEVPEYIQNLTGITTKQLQDAPMIDEVLEEFVKFAGDLVIVGHNVVFDMRFINSTLHSLKMPSIENDMIDTLRIARKLVGKEEIGNHRLSTLASYFDVEVTTCHRALADCETTLGVYLGLKELACQRYKSLDCFCQQFTRNRVQSTLNKPLKKALYHYPMETQEKEDK